MVMLIQVAAAFMAIAAFSVAMEVPKEYLPYCGCIGAAGWFVYLIVLQLMGMIAANFFGAAVITLIAHIFARIRKAPVTIFLIPGFLTMVPGAGLYRSVHYRILGDAEQGAAYLIQTMQIAGVIALGVFLVDSFFEILTKRKQNEEKKNEQKK